MDGSKQPLTLESLCGPSGLAVDGTGALYVADSNNCRVMKFDDPFATDQVAEAVLGQADGKCGRDATHVSSPAQSPAMVLGTGEIKFPQSQVTSPKSHVR